MNCPIQINGKNFENHEKEINEVYTKYSQYAERDSIDSERFGWLEKPFKTITYAEASDVL